MKGKGRGTATGREGEREGERLLGSVCLIDKRGSE